MLVDLYGIRRRRIRRRRSVLHKNDDVLEPAIADFDGFSHRVGIVLLAIRIGGHLNFFIRGRRSFERDLTGYCSGSIGSRTTAARGRSATRGWQTWSLVTTASATRKREDKD